MNKALFLDRDGVINKNFGHVYRVKNFKFRKGIFELAKFFQDNGFLILVITNQAGIGKGLYSLNDFNLLNNWMISKFFEEGVTISKTFYCPHLPEINCDCRKPKPGLILLASKEFNIDLKKSYLIGDKDSDISSGKAANVKKLFKVQKTLDLIVRKVKNKL